jgi:hypothetical protein
MKLTDAEKTKLLAEVGMGWTHIPETKRMRGHWMDGVKEVMYVESQWYPLTNESHAAEVRERMIELGNELAMVYGTSRTWVSMRKHPIDNTRHGERGQMCRLSADCALLALGLATEEQL